MRLILTALMTLPALAGLGLNNSAAAQTRDNQPISRSDIPSAVWDTVRSVAPTAAFTEFGLEREADVNVYELGAIDPDGLHLELDVLTDGTLQEIEWETPLSKVQMPVRNEFRFLHPNAEITYV